MAEFFGGRFLRWLTLPYRVGGRRGSRVLEFASRPFSQLADRILGGAFLEDIGEFFANFQSMYDGFVARAEAVERLLHDRRTTFAVVTTLEPAPFHEAERFCAALDERGFHLGALVCNRTLPDLLLEPDAAEAAAICRADAGAVAADLAAEPVAGLADAARTARVLRIVGESFDRFAVVARRESELRGELAGRCEVVARVPALVGDVGDVAALAAIARHLFDGDPADGP
jgi:anion-transporting  ArsA/GET3 family ATPase